MGTGNKTQEEEQVLLSLELSLKPHKLILKSLPANKGGQERQLSYLSRSMTRTYTGTLVGDSPEPEAPVCGEQRARG